MPVFNVQIIQRVTKRSADQLEATVIDRVIASETNLVAVDMQGAAAAAGRHVDSEYDAELFSAVMVRVQKVCD